MSERMLTVSSSPHAFTQDDTRSVMLDMCIALVFPLAIAVYFFGPRALVLTVISVASCVLFEVLVCKILKRAVPVGDLSAVVTGLFLAFCLPVSVPVWLPVVGALFAMVVVKQLYGGLGKNFLNPALAARAFLFAAWPALMTAWSKITLPPFTDALPAFRTVSVPDALSAATPLKLLKVGQLPDLSLWDAFRGEMAGSMGEISALMLLVAGVFLVVRRVITPRIPLCYIATVAVLTFAFPRFGAPNLEWMLWQLLSGGLMLGAIFMATDYSTSPVTKRGQVLYGIGCGVLTVCIRYFGSYPEGVCYSILLMNTAVWLLDKLGLPRRFGVRRFDRFFAHFRKKQPGGGGVK